MPVVLRLETTVARLEREMSRAQVVVADSTRRMQGDMTRATRSMATSSRRAADGLGGMMNISRQGRFVLQNTSAQIGDIAVQLEQGTSASRVMSQQLPQLLGGFGALGGSLGMIAPLLGTVAAVGIPLAAMFLRNRDGSRAAAAELDAFAEALGSAETAIGRADAAMALAAHSGADALADQYGFVTARVEDLADALADIEVRAARMEISSVLRQALGGSFRDELDGLFGNVGRALVEAGSEAAQREVAQLQALIRNVQAEVSSFELQGLAAPSATLRELEELQAELAAVEGRIADIGYLASEMSLVPLDALQNIADLRTRLEEARAAGDFSVIANTLNDLRNALVSTGEEIDQSVIDGLVHAEDMARRFADVLGEADKVATDIGTAAGEIGGALDPAIAQAARLARWFGISLTRASALAQMGPQGAPGEGGDGLVSSGRGRDPREQGGSFYDWQTRIAANYTPPHASAGGGGGGGAQEEINEAMRAAAQIIREVQRETVTLADIQEALNAELQAGEISTEEYAAAMEVAADRFSGANDGLRSIADLLADMAVNWENVGDIAVNALRRITQQLLSRALTQGLERLAGGTGGGLFSTIATGLFGGFRAKGGPVSSGKGYIVGENGPEFFMPGTSGSIVPSAAGFSAPAMPSMGGGVVVNFTNQVEGAEVQHTGSQRMADGRTMENFVLAVTRRHMADGAFDGVMGGRFGASPRRVRQ